MTKLERLNTKKNILSLSLDKNIIFLLGIWCPLMSLGRGRMTWINLDKTQLWKKKLISLDRSRKHYLSPLELTSHGSPSGRTKDKLRRRWLGASIGHNVNVNFFNNKLNHRALVGKKSNAAGDLCGSESQSRGSLGYLGYANGQSFSLARVLVVFGRKGNVC